MVNMKNKMIKIIFTVISSFIICTTTISFADENEYINEQELQNQIIETIYNQKQESVQTGNNIKTNKPILNSRRYVIFDRTSGLNIYGKDENRQTAMASTTKIMTAIIVLENCNDLNEIIKIDAKSATTGGSRLGLKNGDEISIRDLLYGLLLRSGNDAAVALATKFGGDINGFAKLMNDKAKALNLKNTHFVTPHGLDDPNHYTTALELAIITDYALKNEIFSEIVRTKKANIKINNCSIEIKNTNEILCSNIDGVYGVKTGFTNIAGRCLVTAIKRNEMDLIIVVLGADTRKDRAKDTLELINYAFNTFKVEAVETKVAEEFEMWKQINLQRIAINKGKNKIKAEIKQIPIKKVATDKNINILISNVNYLEAPVNRGTRIGTIIVKNGESIFEEIDIVTSNTVQRLNIRDYLKMMAKCVAIGQ